MNRILVAIALLLTLVGCNDPKPSNSNLNAAEIERLQYFGETYAAAMKAQNAARSDWYRALWALEAKGLKVDYDYPSFHVKRVYKPAEVEALVIYYKDSQ